MSQTTQSSAELKRAFAQEVIANASKKGILNPIVILPAYDELAGELIEDQAVTPSANSTKGMGFINLYQSRTVKLKTSSGTVEFENETWCIHRGKVASLEAKFKAGELLPGKIVLEDTLTPINPNDPSQGLKFPNKACMEAGISLMIGDNPIYQLKWWDETGEVADTTIQHDNQAEIDEITNAAKATAAKPMSRGLQAAAQKAAGRKVMGTK
jgi:hypothetical protein